MSRTWDRHGGWKDRGHDARTAAAREFRRKGPELDVSNGCEYKRFYEQWNICDWNMTNTIEQERYEFHHPLTNWRCMCDIYPSRYRGAKYLRRVDAPAPEPVMLDRSWVLPEDYDFTHRWQKPEQRVNPETGDYEKKLLFKEWEFVGSRPADAEFVFGSSPYYWRKGCRIEWREKMVYRWVHNDEPSVVEYIEAPYFTAKDIQDHVRSREEQTRNYRKKVRFPRYWRRDRKRARYLKSKDGYARQLMNSY